MSKEKLMATIDADVNWRVAEIASIKSLHLRNRLNEKDSDLAIRANIPLVYAIWEGFVVSSLVELVSYLNSLGVDISELDDRLVTHLIDGYAQLHNARSTFESKCKQVGIIREVLSAPASFDVKIETESNVSFKVLNKLMGKFNIDCFDREYKSSLNKLLQYRNSIAHGENALPVNTRILNELSDTVRDIIFVLRDKLEDYIFEEKFKSVA